MKRLLLLRCVTCIVLCGWLVSCNKGMGEYVYIDGCKTLHTDKDCKSIAVFRQSSPVSVCKANGIIAGDWNYVCPKCVSEKDYKTIESIGERNLKAYDIKRELFYSLSKEYEIGTLDQFLLDIEDEGKRRKLYDEIKDEYNLTSFNDFSLHLMGYDNMEESDDDEPEEAEPEYGCEFDEDYSFGRVGH